MFGQIGMQEIILILFILLLLFGAKRLPELGQSLGKGIREFKSGLNEIKEDLEEESKKKPK
jgi:sec-independent protein translocase protein TatA